MTKKPIAIFGSTGSIGKKAFNAVLNQKDNFDLTILTCNANVEMLYSQCLKLKPKFVIVASHDVNVYHWHAKFEELEIKAIFDEHELGILHSIEINTAVVAISGFSCLRYLQALQKNKSLKKICLANKESIVCLGNYLLESFGKLGVDIIPVDSEHNSIFQILQNNNKHVDEIVLTASGGMVFEIPNEQLKNIKLKDVTKHPNWSMGTKITIDSSTMANKGLELIEASRLFNLPQQAIDVAVNPRSIFHGLVKFTDFSVVSFASNPDMLLHIAHSIFYPEPIPEELSKAFLQPYNIYDNKNNCFFKIDYQKYPMLAIARQVCGDNFLSLAYNCINEYLVEMFAEERISFLQIPQNTEKYIYDLAKYRVSIDSFDEAFEAQKFIKAKFF